MADEYKFKGPGYNSAVLEMLVQIAARQEATISLILDKLSEQGESKEKLLAEFQLKVTTIREHLVDRLYETNGSIDIEDLFNS